MVEGHCAKQYADDARQKCVGKRVVEIIWRADPQNQKNVEGVVLSTATRRGRRLVAVECISKQVFLRFADDAAAPTPAVPTRKRSSSVVDLTADSDDDLICRPKKRARGDDGAIDLTLESDDDVCDLTQEDEAPGTMLVELRFGIHGKLSVEASARRGKDFQFALRLDSGQFLVFKSDVERALVTISSEAFAKRRARIGPVDLCGDAFRHGALVDALVTTFRAAAGTRTTAKEAVLHQGTGAPGCGNIIANEGFHLARVDPDAPAASLGRTEADRLAYWLRAYAMRWYREGNALQKHRLVDDRLEADGCGECGGELVQSWADAPGRRARGFACPACLQKPPRPQAVDPMKATWPRPRARVQAPPTAAAALLLPRGGDHGHTCTAPREKLVRVSWPPPWGWRLEYRCGATGCKARGYCDELFANWPTCRCHGREERSGLPYNVAMVDRISSGDRRGELYYQCRHKSSCGKVCGVGRNALSKSGLSTADQARIKEDFGFVKEKCKPLSCCGGKKAKGLKKPKKPRAKK